MTSASGPPARYYHALAYEPTTDRVILFGGTTGTFLREVPMADTWAYDFDSNTWTQLAPSGPSARGWHALAYSDADRAILLFGGGASRVPFLADTWLFDPATDTWSEVLPAD